jgi:hypothetical protein
MQASTSLLLGLALLSLIPGGSPNVLSGQAPPELRFRPGTAGEFAFDTGTLRGVLRPGGKSLGLASVTHIVSGKRLDSSNGLLSHYRVFANGIRYGGGAWDWPSEANVRADGAVEVRWPALGERPFEFRAVYRWHSADLIEVETIVEATKALKGFESFLASYFSQSFTNASVCVGSSEAGGTTKFISLGQAQGDWQMFPRERAVVSILGDGRWQLPPNPVAWVVQPDFALPIGVRKDPGSGLTAALMSRPQDCFAISSPHQGEGHRSMYLSLFGRDLAAGERVAAKVWLSLTIAPSDEQLVKTYEGLQALPR